MKSIKIRNCSIDIFRYVCAIMVVAIHTHPFSDIDKELGYVFTQIVPRIGVPFFFSVAGYFYIAKLEKGYKSFFSYFKKLLITYFIWSCLYYLIDFVQWGYLKPIDYIYNCFFKFVITGSHYHFWFFPAIIFSVCLTTLMFKIRLNKAIIPFSIILYILGCLGCSYYKIGMNIPFLKNLYTFSQFNLIRRVLLMGFPFFICGYLVFKIKEKFFCFITDKMLLIFGGIIFVIWLIEIYVVRELGWQVSIVITVGLYLLVIITMLILIKHPLPKYKLVSAKCKVLANFIYYVHPFCISCLTLCNKKFFHSNLTETPIFILTISLTSFCGLLLYKLDNKLINNMLN